MNVDRIFLPALLALAIGSGLLGWTQGGGFERHPGRLRACLNTAGRAANWGQHVTMDCHPLAR